MKSRFLTVACEGQRDPALRPCLPAPFPPRRQPLASSWPRDSASCCFLPVGPLSLHLLSLYPLLPQERRSSRVVPATVSSGTFPPHPIASVGHFLALVTVWSHLCVYLGLSMPCPRALLLPPGHRLPTDSGRDCLSTNVTLEPGTEPGT